MRGGTLVLLVLLLAACRAPEDRSDLRFPDAPVIVISIDSLRADRLPMYGSRRIQTPHLDEFRRDAILYETAYTHAPLTLPAHVSILTGLLPHEHNVRSDVGWVLNEDVPTLPRMLRARGHATGAAVSAHLLRAGTGLARDFDVYDDAIPVAAERPLREIRRPGRITVEIAAQWIEANVGRPFFYFLHLFEPHAPYEPEEPFRSRYSDRYDGEVATADSIVGAFFERLRSSGVYDRSMIILLSDHGEGLGDHGEPEHGVFLYRQTIRVPLLVKLPGSARGGETVERPVGLVDVLPTVAAAKGLAPPVGARGHSLLGDEPAVRRIYSESLYPRVHLGWSELRSLAGGRFHYVDAPTPELYDLDDDPRQRRNLAEEERRLAARMHAELDRHGSSSRPPNGVDVAEARRLATRGGAAAPDSGRRPDPKERIAELVEVARADELLRRGQPEEAAGVYRRLVERNPHMAEGWIRLGAILEAMESYEEAEESYRRALGAALELAGEIGVRSARVLLRQGRLEEAEEHARLAENIDRGAMHILLARVELARGNHAAAEAQARAAGNDPSHRIPAQLVLAEALALQGRGAEALAIVDSAGQEIEALGLGAVERHHLVRGEILAGLERHDEAVEAFRKEIDRFPSNRQAYASLYLVLLKLERPDEAEAALEAMVRTRPGVPAFLEAARAAEAAGEVGAAEAWRRRAESLR